MSKLSKTVCHNRTTKRQTQHVQCRYPATYRRKHCHCHRTALKKVFDLFVAKVATINSLISGQGEGSTGESLTKAQAKSILTNAYNDLAQQLFAWAADTNNPVAQQKADLSITTVTRLKDSILPSQAEDFYTLAVANKAALLEFGVTSETLESFAEAIDDFSEAPQQNQQPQYQRQKHDGAV